MRKNIKLRINISTENQNTSDGVSQIRGQKRWKIFEFSRVVYCPTIAEKTRV